MKNDVKHPHFRHKLEYYLKGLITKNFTLKQVAVPTCYTIPHLSYLKKRYEKEETSYQAIQKVSKVRH